MWSLGHFCTSHMQILDTGRYPYRKGVYHAYKFDAYKTPAMTGVTGKDETLASVLGSVGYKTHAVGKWHVGGGRAGDNPTDVGFDSFYGMLNGVSDYFTNWIGVGNAMRRETKGGTIDSPDDNGTYNSFVLSREAKRVVEEHNQADGQLFLYLSFFAVVSEESASEAFACP